MAEPNEISPEAKRRRRRIYVKQRFLILHAEMEKVEQETGDLVKKLASDQPASKSPRRIELQKRLIYLREHWPNLMAEFHSIRDENKALQIKKGSI